MRIKKISQPLEVESSVIDSLESNSTTNAPSIHAVNELVSYSTEEKKIGTWIDGKPLYRKVVVGTTPETEETWAIVGSIGSGTQVKKIQGSLGNYLSIPTYVRSSYYVAVQVAGGEVQVYTKGYTKSGVEIIVEYTKTTD